MRSRSAGLRHEVNRSTKSRSNSEGCPQFTSLSLEKTNQPAKQTSVTTYPCSTMFNGSIQYHL